MESDSELEDDEDDEDDDEEEEYQYVPAHHRAGNGRQPGARPGPVPKPKPPPVAPLHQPWEEIGAGVFRPVNVRARKTALSLFGAQGLGFRYPH